jgi:hypothetical protein
MSLYERYKDEAEFRDKFVKPLLNRMGFYGVEEQHGTQEFGKDFVFSELHRLGGMRHYAAQVKHEDKISQGKVVDDLLTQIEQAFEVPFKRTDSPRPCHVSAVYVFNSGEITPNARTQMLAKLEKKNFGDNVHFMDGERLQALNEYSVYYTEGNARRRLNALTAQIDMNKHILQSLKNFKPEKQTLESGEKASSIPDPRGFMWSAIDSYLAEPLPDTDILYEHLTTLWQYLRITDCIRQRLIDCTIHAAFRDGEVEQMRNVIGLTEGVVQKIDPAITRLLSRYQRII